MMLIGNLGKDPDLQYLEGNIAVAKFPLATTVRLVVITTPIFIKLLAMSIVASSILGWSSKRMV